MELIDHDGTISWAEIDQHAQQLADVLRPLAPRVLALLADNGRGWIIADRAAQQLNIPLLPLPAFFTATQQQHALQQSGCNLLLSDHPIKQGAPATSPILETLGFYLTQLDYEAQSLPANVSKITFTSGSTGTPKGVCLSLQQQQRVAQSLASRIAPWSGRHLCLLPFPILLENVAGIYTAEAGGATLICPPLASLGWRGGGQIDASALMESIEQWQPNTLILLPQLLQLLVQGVQSGWQPPCTLQLLAVGGARVSPQLLQQARQLGLPAYEGYGLSECASVVSLNTPDDDQPGSCGKPLPHLELQVDASGELLIQGNTFLGYLGDHEPPAPQLATGDLGRLDEAGFLHLQGRRKNLLITSYGRNISPEWVESELHAQPGIAQAIVFGDARPFLCALIAAPTLDNDQLAEQVQRVNQRLPDYARLRAFIQLEQPLPPGSEFWTHNGRPRRAALEAHFHTWIDNLYTPSYS